MVFKCSGQLLSGGGRRGEWGIRWRPWRGALGPSFAHTTITVVTDAAGNTLYALSRKVYHDAILHDVAFVAEDGVGREVFEVRGLACSEYRKALSCSLPRQDRLPRPATRLADARLAVAPSPRSSPSDLPPPDRRPNANPLPQNRHQLGRVLGRRDRGHGGVRGADMSRSARGAPFDRGSADCKLTPERACLVSRRGQVCLSRVRQSRTCDASEQEHTPRSPPLPHPHAARLASLTLASHLPSTTSSSRPASTLPSSPPWLSALTSSRTRASGTARTAASRCPRSAASSCDRQRGWDVCFGTGPSRARSGARARRGRCAHVVASSRSFRARPHGFFLAPSGLGRVAAVAAARLPDCDGAIASPLRRAPSLRSRTHPWHYACMLTTVTLCKAPDAENSSHIRDEPETVEDGDALEQRLVVGIRGPALDREGVGWGGASALISVSCGPRGCCRHASRAGGQLATPARSPSR